MFAVSDFLLPKIGRKVGFEMRTQTDATEAKRIIEGFEYSNPDASLEEKVEHAYRSGKLDIVDAVGPQIGVLKMLTYRLNAWEAEAREDRRKVVEIDLQDMLELSDAFYTQLSNIQRVLDSRKGI